MYNGGTVKRGWAARFIPCTERKYDFVINSDRVLPPEMMKQLSDGGLENIIDIPVEVGGRKR